MRKELITQMGFKKFLDEFNNLLKIEKPYWVKEKEIAAQFGDRSENAEYISAKVYIIVGTYETNPSENMISNKSPLGKALLNKSKNEEFEFIINNETFVYEILDIKKYNFKVD